MALLLCFAVLPPAPEVLAEIKLIFDSAFCVLILRLEFHTMPFKISFRMAWLTWLSHCIIFQVRKRNNELADYQICCLLFGFFFLTKQKRMLSSNLG